MDGKGGASLDSSRVPGDMVTLRGGHCTRTWCPSLS